MAIGNVELIHECFPKHSRMGTATLIKTKKQKNVSREAWVWKEVQLTCKKKSRRPITTYSKDNNNKNNTVAFYKIWKKYNEIKKKQLAQTIENDASSTLIRGNKAKKLMKQASRKEWKWKVGTKKKSQRPNYSSDQPSPWGRYSPKHWMNYLANLTYTYNPSTTTWGEVVDELPKELDLKL